MHKYPLTAVKIKTATWYC